MSNRGEEKGTTQISSVQVIERKAAWPVSALFLGNTVSSIGDILTLLAIPGLFCRPQGAWCKLVLRDSAQLCPWCFQDSLAASW